MGGTIKDASTDFGAQTDIWSCNVNLDNGSGAPVTDPAGFLALIVGAMATWYAATASGMASTSTLDYMKANTIGPDGKYVSTSTSNRYDWATPVAGGLGPQVPSMLSLAWSWGTARQRGAGSHGRIYPPNYVYSASGTPYVSSGNRTSAATAAHNFLSVLLNAGISRPVIASKVDGSLTPITRIRVGARYDVQRRRENNVPEQYTAWGAFPG